MEPSVSDTPSPLELSPNNNVERTTPRSKSLSHFFGVESSDLAKPYHEASITSSPGTKAKFGRLSPKITKKLNVADALGLGSSKNNGHSCSNQDSQVTRQMNVGHNGAPGLLLKTRSPKFIKKFQNCEGSLKNFTRRDKSPNGRTSTKELSPRKRSRAKSLTVMLEKNFPLLRKDESSLKPMAELSTEESSPGLLKIFGDNICPNAKYKTVLASSESSAVGLVKVALERFSLPVDTFGEYVLCDVVGNYKTNPEKASKILGISEDYEENQEWIVECLRIMWDNERPLSVKSFWKPEEGFARRFEIRRRCDIETSDTDTVTAGLNINAKRLQQSKAYRALTSASLLKPNDTDKKGQNLSSIEQHRTLHTESRSQRQHPQCQMEKEQTESTGKPPVPEVKEPLISISVPAPCDHPYLLTLNGNNQEIDQVLYPLNDPVCLVGNSYGTVTNADIELDSSDVNQEHCKLITVHRPQSLGKDESPSDWDVFLEPFGQSKVLLNGAIVYYRAKLTSGDLISVGNKYLFFFKNPQVQTTFEPPLMRILSGQSDLSNQSQWIRDAPLLARRSNPHIAAKAKEYSEDKQRLKLSYPMKNEDEVLNGIASLFQESMTGESGSDSTLSLAYLMCMCLEHSAYNFGQERTKTLMLKMATVMQTLAWDKTKDIARNQQEKPIDVQTASLLPDLRVIVCLLSNALEVLNFLQTNMRDYVPMENHRDEGTETEGDNTGIENEALVELEEVVMYLFQQMVYCLTKTLFISIPNFLDTNPFSDDQDSGIQRHSQGMDSVLLLFKMTYDLLHDLHIHPDITSQLFAYLSFFTNASLFNMLMERGTSGEFFKWAKAAQIRGNLDILETWMQDHDLKDQIKFLKRVSTAINLLATPKAQLMQADWGSLQRDFSKLNTLQLYHLLSHYQMGSNQLHPTKWSPPPEQLEYAKESENLLESFENHPALLLPKHDFHLDLRHPVGREELAKQLHHFQSCHSYVTVNTVIEEGPANQNSSSPIQPVEARIPRKDSARNDGANKPVPPPRTKSSRYTPTPEKEVEMTPIEILDYFVEVPQVTQESCS